MRRRHDHPLSIEMCLDERRVDLLQATDEHLEGQGSSQPLRDR